MTEFIAPFYTVVVFLKEVAILAFFIVCIVAVIKVIIKDKKEDKGAGK